MVGIITRDCPRWLAEEYLDELELLADTAGAEVVERVVQERDRFDPAYMIGRGKAEELAQIAKYLDADLIIFDDDLSPAQVKNIEKLCGVKILDRSGLILDIFAKHAKTREARTQVELAQLNYILPRLTRQWTHLSRQVGGIGVRGPGETQLEVDRRIIRRRIAHLEKELEKISNQRTIQRKNRQDFFKAALVGYTNVGKSTLLNALTSANVLVEDRLFATLDAIVRSVPIDDNKRILLIDTVGFIRKLPHHLVASFKSTLEEVADADIFLHVIDIAHPNYKDQIKAVETVLEELGINDRPVIKVFNKVDLLKETSMISGIKVKEQPCVFVSAQRGIYLNQLIEKIVEQAENSYRLFKIRLTHEQAPLVSKFFSQVHVKNVFYEDEAIYLDIKIRLSEEKKVQSIIEKYQLPLEEQKR